MPPSGFSVAQGGAISSAFTSQRFSARDVVLTAGVPVDLVRMSTNSPAKSNQRFVLKSIRSKIYLPLCVDADGNVILGESDIVGLFHEYTFLVKINDMAMVYPVTFIKNIDEQYSNNYYSVFDAGINSVAVQVIRDSFPVTVPPIDTTPVSLSLIFDGWLE